MLKKLHLKSRFWYLIPFILFALVDSLTLLPILFGALKNIKSTSASLGLVALSMFIYIILIALVWKLYRHISHRPIFNLSEIIKTKKQDWKLVGLGFISLIIINFIASIFASSTTTNQSELLIALKSNFIYKYGLIFCSVILAPILEELLYRGVLMRIISPKLSVLSIIVSLIVFNCMHQGFTLSAFISYGGFGLIFAIMYAKSHSLKSNTLLHMLTNLILYI